MLASRGSTLVKMELCVCVGGGVIQDLEQEGEIGNIIHYRTALSIGGSITHLFSRSPSPFCETEKILETRVGKARTIVLPLSQARSIYRNADVELE